MLGMEFVSNLFFIGTAVSEQIGLSRGGRYVVSLDEESIPLSQQFTRSDSPHGDNVCLISLIAAPGRGTAVRVWRRHLSWNRSLLVEQFGPDVCREDEQKMSSS